jgi:hypothetical protein
MGFCDIWREAEDRDTSQQLFSVRCAVDLYTCSVNTYLRVARSKIQQSVSSIF